MRFDGLRILPGARQRHQGGPTSVKARKPTLCTFFMRGARESYPSLRNARRRVLLGRGHFETAEGAWTWTSRGASVFPPLRLGDEEIAKRLDAGDVLHL